MVRLSGPGTHTLRPEEQPDGGAVLSASGSYVGTEGALVKVNRSADIIFVGSEGASIGAGSTILRPLLISP